MKSTIAFILGGGKGTRIYPLTKDRSKPAIPLGGKYRIIDIPISNCINSQIHQIFVLTQFNSQSLNHHVSHTYRFDKFSHGFVDILPADQTEDREDWYQGTADAIRRNLKYLASFPQCEDILILSGDQLYRMDFQLLIAEHRNQDADVTIATYPVSQSQVGVFGVMKLQSGGTDCRITDFIEKPTDPRIVEDFVVPNPVAESWLMPPGKRHLASMGIYVFKRRVLEAYLKTSTHEDFGKQVIPEMIQSYRVIPYRFDGYWEDIGTIRAFHKAHMDMLGRQPKFQLYVPGSPYYSSARFLPPALISGSVVNSIVVDGVKILDASISNSIIGVRSIIHSGAKLTNVLVMGSDGYESGIDEISGGIGEGSIIENAIIDKSVKIGKNVHLTNRHRILHYRNPEETIFIRDGIIVIPKNAVIPDGFSI